jgi:predicted HTH domain antitoxin
MKSVDGQRVTMYTEKPARKIADAIRSSRRLGEEIAVILVRRPFGTFGEGNVR